MHARRLPPLGRDDRLHDRLQQRVEHEQQLLERLFFLGIIVEQLEQQLLKLFLRGELIGRKRGERRLIERRSVEQRGERDLLPGL